MNQINLPLLFTAFFALAFPVQAQSLDQLSSMDEKYQTCLDKGSFMLACSQDYYTKLDELLNLSYNKIQTSLDPSKKAALKEEHVQWLGERDVYFTKVDKEYAVETGQDQRMIAKDKKAEFVRKRVEELIIRMGKS